MSGYFELWDDVRDVVGSWPVLLRASVLHVDDSRQLP